MKILITKLCALRKEPLSIVLAIIFVALFSYICYSNAVILPYTLNSDSAANLFIISRAWREGNFLLKDIIYAGDGIFFCALHVIFLFIISFFTDNLMLAAIIDIAIKAAIAFAFLFCLLKQLKLSNVVSLSASIALMLLGNINLFSISLADFPYYNISISIVLLGVILILRMKVKERLTYIDYSIWGIFSFVLGLWGIKGAF